MEKIGSITNDEFALIDYGSHVELYNHSAGYLTFTNWDGLLRLADFINHHLGHIRSQPATSQSETTPSPPPKQATRRR